MEPTRAMVTDELAAFERWKACIADAARCQNVVLKLGGLTPPAEMPMHMSRRTAGPISSEQLAGLWLPFHDYALKAFGPQRCMFESCVAASPRICAASGLACLHGRLLPSFCGPGISPSTRSACRTEASGTPSSGSPLAAG